MLPKREPLAAAGELLAGGLLLPKGDDVVLLAGRDAALDAEAVGLLVGFFSSGLLPPPKREVSPPRRDVRPPLPESAVFLSTGFFSSGLLPPPKREVRLPNAPPDVLLSAGLDAVADEAPAGFFSSGLPPPLKREVKPPRREPMPPPDSAFLSSAFLSSGLLLGGALGRAALLADAEGLAPPLDGLPKRDAPLPPELPDCGALEPP
jgi:hypothetical protein